LVGSLAMLERILEWWKSKETREVLLVIITGLVVAYVRHGLEHHWKSWDTWQDFFATWFVDVFAVAVSIAIAYAAIMATHKFFLGREMPDLPLVPLPPFMTSITAIDSCNTNCTARMTNARLSLVNTQHNV
jgi:hypothetical protein